MKWFRFYDEVLDDPKVQRLPLALRWHWINLLCLANRQENRGRLPDIETVAFALRLPQKQAERVVADLVTARLIDEREALTMHNWDKRQPKRDETAQRVQDWRDKQRDERVTERVTCNTDGNAASATQRRGDTEEIQRRGDTETEENDLQPPKSNIFILYEQHIGTINPHMAETLQAAEEEFSPECIDHAFKAATEHNAHSWAYVVAILKSHKASGSCYGTGGNRAKPERGSTAVAANNGPDLDAWRRA